jgi:UDP-N-acetylglucosamine 1-carboxyvinyltransferase
MADLIINGGKPLEGVIRPSGNKNAVLPIVCASLLTNRPVKLNNVPYITDVEKLIQFFEAQGSTVRWDKEGQCLELDHAGFSSEQIADLPAGMRSSVLLFAPLLHRWGTLKILTNVKGCALGVRELDPHLEILSHFGVQAGRGNPLKLVFGGKFKPCRHWSDYMSVTATETFLMAAVISEGESTLINAASEPHVQDLCRFLKQLGAEIAGVGTSMLKVKGGKPLGGADVIIASDYHEIATFLALGAITGGEVTVTGAVPHHFDLISRSFDKLGVVIEEGSEKGVPTATVRPNQALKVQDPFTTNLLAKIEAAPWPYFPVDLLPIMVALSVRAQGSMLFWNKVYEGGFSWLPELTKFGAHVVVADPHRVIVFGNKPLRPATVESPYIIRAAIALFMVAASIPGNSRVKNADPICRAHPHFVENLQRLGASVVWE